MAKPIISRIWLGPKEMPAEYVEYRDRWALLNPGWEVRDYMLADVEAVQWRNQAVTDDIRKRGGDSIEAAVQIADVIAYELVWLLGGIYVNVDVEPVRSLDCFFERHSIPMEAAYAGREDTGTMRIVNAVMGGPPQHPFWDHMIKALPVTYWAHPGDDMVATTGPGLLTAHVYAWRDPDYPFKIFSQRAFNSVHWSDIPYGSNADGLWQDNDEIVAIHHWNHRRDGRSNTVGGNTRAT